MKKRTHAEQFISLFKYWCGRLKLPKPIPTVRDNRENCTAALNYWWDKDKIQLQYNTKKLGRLSKSAWMSEMFHEIGHIVNGLPYGTYKTQVISEREAERFSIKMMKKHYPKQFKILIQNFIKYQTMKKYKKDPEDLLYYDAYYGLSDYRKTIRGD